MILKALYDYYHRSDRMPTIGWQEKEIDFLIVIEGNGKFKKIEDCRDGNHGRNMIVPKEVERSRNVSANLLWDKIAYIIGIQKNSAKKDSLQKCHNKFRLCNESCG